VYHRLMGVNTEYLRKMITLFGSIFTLYAAGLMGAQEPEIWATSK